MELPGDAVIIATGGMHGLFGNTTGSLSNTGEVTAELFRLGVPLANGEMIQYHPTTVKCGGKRILISEAARGEGGRLFAMKDGKQWYFMEKKYPELGNLMPRDITAREIWKVSHESEVFLDMTEISEEIISNKLSGLADDCMTYLHKDIRKEPVSVLPGIHYFMGAFWWMSSTERRFRIFTLPENAVPISWCQPSWWKFSVRSVIRRTCCGKISM